MNCGDLLHNLHCPLGSKCLNGNPIRVLRIDPSTAPVNDKYELYDGEEKILFHGTSNSEWIEREGFRTDTCGDRTFGEGLYMSPCLHTSVGFCGNEGIIYICRVKVGKCETFYGCTYEDKGQDTSILYCFAEEKLNPKTYDPEYVIYDVSRINIIGILNMDTNM